MTLSRLCFCFMSYALLALNANAADRQLSLTPDENQDSKYVDGVRWVIADTAFQVRVAASSELNDRKTAWLRLFIINQDANNIDILPSEIVVSSSNGNLKVFTPEEVLKKEKRRQAWQDLAAGLAAGMNSYNASNAGYYSESGSFQGSSNNGYASGTYRAHGYDTSSAAAANAEATEQNHRMLTNVEQEQLYRSMTLQERLLKAQTVAPGESYEGDVLFELPRPSRKIKQQDLMIEVAINGEKIPFKMTLEH